MISVDYSKKIKVKRETREVEEEEEKEEEREQAGELNSSSSLDQLPSFSSCPLSPAPSNNFVNTKESQPGWKKKISCQKGKVFSCGTCHLEKNQKYISESGVNEGAH
jgi:hypothetical protein